jgi:probable HAF family extracellular repeat protein
MYPVQPQPKLLTTPGASGASGINNAGQIVFLNGVLSGGPFTTLSVPGSTANLAFGINNLGQIVGSYSDTSLQLLNHGFVYSDGTYTSFDVPGSIATVAFGINDFGQIVGYYVDSADNQHGFLATPTQAPVPEPATLLLAIGTLGVIGWVWWRGSRVGGVNASLRR